MVRLWSSPPQFPARAMSRCPRSNRSCAASTSFRRGSGCLICRSGSCTSRPTTARVGVSAAFRDLRDTPPALHFARVMLRGPADSTSSVAVFDGSILATAAVSAPEAMIKTVGAALDGFGHLPDEDRETLFETFRAWLDNDASVCAARLRCLSATRTPCATGCVGSRNTPADPFNGRRMSPNYVWLSKYTAVLSSRDPLTLWTSGEPPRGRGSIPHAGGSRH